MKIKFNYEEEKFFSVLYLLGVSEDFIDHLKLNLRKKIYKIDSYSYKQKFFKDFSAKFEKVNKRKPTIDEFKKIHRDRLCVLFKHKIFLDLCLTQYGIKAGSDFYNEIDDKIYDYASKNNLV